MCTHVLPHTCMIVTSAVAVTQVSMCIQCNSLPLGLVYINMPLYTSTHTLCGILLSMYMYHVYLGGGVGHLGVWRELTIKDLYPSSQGRCPIHFVSTCCTVWVCIVY